MKKLILIILVLTVASYGFADNTKPFKKNFKNYKTSGETFRFTIPNILIKTAGAISSDKSFSLVTRKIKRIKFVYIEKCSDNESICDDFTKSVEKSKYKELIVIKSEDTGLKFLAKEKKGKIKNLILIIEDKDEYAFLDIKSKIRIKDINKLIKLIDSNTSSKIKF